MSRAWRYIYRNIQESTAATPTGRPILDAILDAILLVVAHMWPVVTEVAQLAKIAQIATQMRHMMMMMVMAIDDSGCGCGRGSCDARRCRRTGRLYAARRAARVQLAGLILLEDHVAESKRRTGTAGQY